MNKAELINEVAGRLKAYQLNHDIEAYLLSEGIPEDEVPSIIEAAHAQLLQDKVNYFAKRNLWVFVAWVSAGLVTLVLFLFILPYKNITGYQTFLSILGAALFCLFWFMAVVYNHSWKPEAIEKQEKPTPDFSFLFIFLVPAAIIYFIFSWRLSSGQNEVLKQSQEKATGTILSGKSTSLKRLRGGAVDFSEVTVAFETNDGKSIVASEDVSSYEFKQFFIGQQVELIYSKKDPQNIDLLTNSSSIKEFIGSEERQLAVQDLLNIMNQRKDTILTSLNKIKYGWRYDDKNDRWLNDKTGSALVVNNGELMYISGYEAMFVYPKEFLAMGFTQTNAEQKGILKLYGNKTFENAEYTAIIKRVGNDGTEQAMTTITKK